MQHESSLLEEEQPEQEDEGHLCDAEDRDEEGHGEDDNNNMESSFRLRNPNNIAVALSLNRRPEIGPFGDWLVYIHIYIYII
jgi:hypothetical protein